ncbi:MAG: putative repeat protein (TIGR03806 family), partial [Verrucomicrobiales bacterium]
MAAILLYSKSRKCFAAMVALSLALALSGNAQNYGLETAEPIGGYLDGVFPTTTPGPSGAWALVDAFPNISFVDPVRVAIEPDNDDNLYVVCRNGEIWKMPDDPTATTAERTRFLDRRSTTWGYWDAGMMSLSFHPEFGQAGSPNRGYCYVYYQYSPSPNNSSENNPSYMRFSRFTVPDGSDQVDSNSELVMIQQFDRHNWHGGGQSFFGADGFLYVIFGDEGNANDSYEVAQKIDDRIFSGILRIDVDQDPARSHPIRRQPQEISSRPGGWPASFTQGYYIPNDNPWQDPSGGTLEEFWTIGLRSPYSMHYDKGSGNIWVAEVGQGAREEVTIAQQGGNHQWPFKEGAINGPKPIPSPLIGIENPPIYDYPRSDGGCTIGGIVYRGTELGGSLTGKYIFGDHNSRKLWAMTYVPGEAPQIEFLTNVFRSGGTKRGLSGISANAMGEPYICELGDTGTNTGTIYRLTRSGTPVAEPPALLSQTGAFANLSTLEPRAGLLPYDLNAPLWSDNAEKRRWIAIPNDGSHDSAAEQIQFSQQGNWEFPEGTVIVKHFELPVDENNPNTLRRLETRFLVKGNDKIYYGITYRWNPQGTDATLLSAGQVENISITQADGSTRQQEWIYPSRSDCRTCHTPAAGHVLGLRTHGLNHDMYFPLTDRSDNILRAWNHVGLFSPSLTEADIPGFLQAAHVQDSSSSKTHRVRSWLDSNCSQCHQPGGVLANFDARFTTPFGQQGLVDGILNGSYAVTNPVVVAGGDLSRSILYQRDNSLGPSAMPPLAKNLIHTEAMTLMAEWINAIPSNLTQLAGANASQSSTGSGGFAPRAIDGNTDGDLSNNSVTLTANTANPWWEVDLGDIMDIDHLVIWPRTDCCGERMDGYYVFVSDTPFTSNDIATTTNQPGVLSQHFVTRPSPTHQVFTNRSGRFVRIQLTGTDPLSLAEVEVFGNTDAPTQSAPSISGFAASPPTITAGSSTTLSWTTADGGAALSSLSIDNGIGSVLNSSSISVAPAATTNYTITATNSVGSATAVATVTVTPPTGGGSDEYAPDADTVALYHFNGNYSDSSSNNNHLTATGGVTRTSANLGWMGNPTGQVARFSTVGDSLSVDIPDSIVMPGSGQPLTIDARIRPDAWLAYGVNNVAVIAFHQEWNSHFVIEDSKWGSNPKGPDVVSSGATLLTAQQWASSVTLGQWHQVRVEYDGDEMVSCIIDGVTISSVAMPPDIDRNTPWTLSLGNFDGDLDELYITRSIIIDGPDITSPAVALSTQSSTVRGEFIVSASFSENVNGLGLDDISITNGSAVALSGSGSNYSFSIAPGAVGDVAVQLLASAAFDAAGNPSAASNLLTVAFHPDITPPTVALDTQSLNVSGDFTVGASFSENVNGLGLDDIVVTNGIASALSGSGSNYSFSIAPGTAGGVIVQLLASAAFDAAGNPNNASDQLNVAFDDSPPGGGDEQIADANTVALYHFNSDYNDASANQLHLSIGGSVLLSADNLGWMETPAGQVARFGEIGDTLSVAIPDNLMLVAGDTRPVTIEARIYPRSWLGYGFANLSIITLDQDWDTNLTLEDSKWGSTPKGPSIL